MVLLLGNLVLGAGWSRIPDQQHLGWHAWGEGEDDKWQKSWAHFFLKNTHAELDKKKVKHEMLPCGNFRKQTLEMMPRGFLSRGLRPSSWFAVSGSHARQTPLSSK